MGRNPQLGAFGNKICGCKTTPLVGEGGRGKEMPPILSQNGTRPRLVKPTHIIPCGAHAVVTYTLCVFHNNCFNRPQQNIQSDHTGSLVLIGWPDGSQSTARSLWQQNLWVQNHPFLSHLPTDLPTCEAPDDSESDELSELEVWDVRKHLAHLGAFSGSAFKRA